LQRGAKNKRRRFAGAYNAGIDAVLEKSEKIKALLEL
jgi:hypothetical protein